MLVEQMNRSQLESCVFGVTIAIDVAVAVTVIVVVAIANNMCGVAECTMCDYVNLTCDFRSCAYLPSPFGVVLSSYYYFLDSRNSHACLLTLFFLYTKKFQFYSTQTDNVFICVLAHLISKSVRVKQNTKMKLNVIYFIQQSANLLFLFSGDQIYAKYVIKCGSTHTKQ